MTETETQTMTFGHLEIEYDDRVLTPRPWTRTQSAWAAELLPELPPGDVLELCAGAGHIGLLAISGTSRHLVQVDADKAAADYARANADRARSTGTPAGSSAGSEPERGWTVEIRHGWLEEALEADERFLLVIADPPWVRAGETALHPDDPLTAIDGGSDGLDSVRSCLDVIGRHLATEGTALLQLGDLSQVEAVSRHLEDRPQLDLVPVEHRRFDGGTLVRLVRLARLPTGATG